MTDARDILSCFEFLALEAGKVVMEVRAGGTVADTKADSSPVTEADLRAEKIILEGLRARFPDILCVAEEEVAQGLAPAACGEEFFLVDPLDGTKEFVSGGTDFTVNIALVSGGVPRVGVVYAPARNMLFSGSPEGAVQVRTDSGHRALERRAITVRPREEPPLVVASRSHRTPETDSFIDRFPGAETVSVGSSLKFCLVASGEADLYPRFGPTMQWDTAAGDAVVRAAGGTTCTLDGEPLRYGQRGGTTGKPFLNPFFVVEGRAFAGGTGLE